jgi:hypothetical protein
VIVKVEIEEAAAGLWKIAPPGQVVACASRSLCDMPAEVRPVARGFVDGFRGMTDAPDETGAECGHSLSAEADVVVSRATATADFKVSLTWHKPGEPAR